jgi:hypothetical protein
MSKGHGKWERAILRALEQVPAFYLTDLLPEPHTRSQIVALNRAARNLCDAGKIELIRWLCRASGELPHGFVTVYRVGYPAPERSHITRLKRCIGASDIPMQHL